MNASNPLPAAATGSDPGSERGSQFLPYTVETLSDRRNVMIRPMNPGDADAERDFIVARHRITQVYQLAALLSVTGEQAPLRAWSLNMNGLLNILELARERNAAGTPLSDRLSKALRKQGFTFVGTTICYAFLQATGMVNDHLLDCFCREKSAQ